MWILLLVNFLKSCNSFKSGVVEFFILLLSGVDVLLPVISVLSFSAFFVFQISFDL